jgi:hypothetical protein
LLVFPELSLTGPGTTTLPAHPAIGSWNLCLPPPVPPHYRHCGAHMNFRPAPERARPFTPAPMACDIRRVTVQA